MRRSTVALVRHRGSESWASVRCVFGGIERAVRRHFTPRLLSPHVLQLSWADSLDEFSRFLRGCDAAVVDAVRSPLATFFVRERDGLDFPVLPHELGDLPRGAMGLRAVLPYLRRNDTIVVSCSADREILRNLVARTPARVAVIPFGVDTERFQPGGPGRRRRARRELGYGEEDVVLVSCGRATSEKNVHAVLALLGELARREPRIRLLVIGPVADYPFTEFGTGPHALGELYARILRKYDCAGRVQWLGMQPQESLPALYSAGDIFVNLTLHHDENFGFSNVEAMACGLPVVGTAWGGGRDTIREGVGGHRVPALLTSQGVRADLHAAFQAVAALVADPEARQALGRSARREVVARFSGRRFEEAIAGEIAGALRRPLGGGGRGSTLTPLGRALAARFLDRSAPIPGGQPLRPRYPSPRAAIYRRLIGPYSSGRACTRVGRTSLLALASPLVTIDGRGLRIEDPLWPVAITPIRARHRAVARVLDERGFLSLAELEATLAPRFAAAEVRLAARELLLAGAVVRSTVPRPAAEAP